MTTTTTRAPHDFAKINATNERIATLRQDEIWSDNNGRMVCVTKHCAGYTLFVETGTNPRKGTTWDGAYRLTPAERAEMRDFFTNEMGKANPTCACGRLAI